MNDGANDTLYKGHEKNSSPNINNNSFIKAMKSNNQGS